MGWNQSDPSGAEPYVRPVRRKSEVVWSGLTGRTFTGDTDINLINYLKGLPAPTSGSLLPFFNTTTDKLNAFNSDTTLTFKISVVGSWNTGSSNRSLQVDFSGTTGNRLVESRDAAVISDNITLATFFSIDAGGNIVTNGAPIILRSNGGTFTLNTILLVAEQTTTLTDISAV